MIELAQDLYLLDGFPRYAVNVYMMGGVLVDAGTRWAKRRILRQIKGRRVTAHALTHVHPDHQGASKAVCAARDIPLWCGARDADLMESGDWKPLLPDNAITRFLNWLWSGPAHPVDRRLQEGDEVGGFVVVDCPGHTPGHIAFWREADRALILGDVLNNMNLITMQPGLRQPPARYTPDPALNRDSARKLAALRPSLVCFGHGAPLRDNGRFAAFVDRLPAY